tara:strand:- start:682 stop:981 length:300 start_codon:yes stop_codon:yes gene_type:complete
MYYVVEIGTSRQEERERLASLLLEKKLVVDTFFVEGKSHYLWKGKVEEEQCYRLRCHTHSKHREDIIDLVEKESKEEVPLLSFTQVEPSEKVKAWIESI